ncbi:hypothetical protein EGR_06035 [Echinococcus granulosus]|uniref:Uncharacterized protein n=1 Tax=Echinococcus granulosus TaxID=6210 RepID=W6UDG0_ECHGR|nr:hypothetical protein EGR_06035 [Echinococcus granulosus]EUB59043.1 hypothetical protein EGR_06035 [Echinococcus granulosus]
MSSFQSAVNLVSAPIFIPPLCLSAWQVLALSPRPSDKRPRLLFQLHPPSISDQQEIESPCPEFEYSSDSQFQAA